MAPRGERTPAESSSGRLSLADAITHSENPLTARVLANRMWQHHFGRGLVATPGDFGLRSEPPTHPRLLDHLARRLHETGWSQKAVHREIVLSATYRQASGHRPAAAAVDAGNRLWWRADRRRLSYEQMQDALMTAAGSLRRVRVGPSLRTPKDQRRHRAIYHLVDRNNRAAEHLAFDMPNPDATTGRRPATTVPQQALYLLNSPAVQDLSDRLARNVLSRAEAVRLSWLYRRVHAREATDAERQLATDYLAGRESDLGAWQELVQALLISNEHLFVD